MLAPSRHYEQNASLVRRAEVEKAFLAANYFDPGVKRIIQDHLFRLFGPHRVPGHVTQIRRIPVKFDPAPLLKCTAHVGTDAHLWPNNTGPEIVNLGEVRSTMSPGG